MRKKKGTEEVVPEDLNSMYSAVKARLRTSNNKHPFDLTIKSARIKLNQPGNII